MNEGREAAMAGEGIRNLLLYIGEDPNREGLVDTPRRVLKAWSEMTSGYAENPKEILSKTFDHEVDELIVLTGAPFVSICEHHLLPFMGVATIGYIPTKGKGVVGLSKLARLLDCFSQRLQLQERLTQQITEALNEYLEPAGAGCVLSAAHSCMSIRGVKKTGSFMVTSSLTGALRDKPEARAEFLSFAKG